MGIVYPKENLIIKENPINIGTTDIGMTINSTFNGIDINIPIKVFVEKDRINLNNKIMKLISKTSCGKIDSHEITARLFEILEDIEKIQLI